VVGGGNDQRSIDAEDSFTSSYGVAELQGRINTLWVNISKSQGTRSSPETGLKGKKGENRS